MEDESGSRGAMTTSTRWYERVPARTCFAIGAGILALQAFLLHLMGHVAICKCGYVKLWHGVVHSSENSQHLSDWYSFTHIIHGFIFYWLLKRLAPRWPAGLRMVATMACEAAWEVLENSPMVINRYRAEANSLDYFGDSIINSVSDVLFCVMGFLLARTLPVGVTIALAIIIEVALAYFIRDNLTLNILMLLYPLDAVRRWQAAAGAI